MVELSQLEKSFEVVPIIRSAKGAARLARLGKIWKFGDAGKPEQLVPLIKGCDAVVNLTIGDFGGMAATAEAVWQACATAGVPKLVHMSTAEVFGRVETPGTSDDSAPLEKHWMPYAMAKVAAESQLRNHFKDERIGCVILRPGLIWGVRSPWVEGPAQDLAAGKAFLINGGKGVCNLIYVDNLIRQILAVVNHPKLVSGCFNVSDDESTNWHDYYLALTKELGIPFAEIHQLPAGPYRPDGAARFADFKQTAPMQWLKHRLDRPAKQKLKVWVAKFQAQPSVSGPVPAPLPAVTRGGWHQQNVIHKRSNNKFRQIFGRTNELSFAEAMSRSGEWLRAGGFGRS